MAAGSGFGRPGPSGFRDVTLRSESMPRKSIGERPMTNAERQARHRAARAAGAPVVRSHRPADRAAGPSAGTMPSPNWQSCRRNTPLGWTRCRTVSKTALPPMRSGRLRPRSHGASGHRTTARVRQGLSIRLPGNTSATPTATTAHSDPTETPEGPRGAFRVRP